ncbi:MAG: M28 family peptidase [Gemmatimonadales bacterium]|nr:M28 family peptidase [Gemmatimonadales bacterium]
MTASALAASFAAFVILCPTLAAQDRPLLPDRTLAALAGELSGEVAKRNLEFIAREHRIRGSVGWRRAGQHIVDQLKSYGIADATIERFPADGKRFYGTQRSRPPWDATFAELWELRREPGGWVRNRRLADWNAMPVTLAQDSESGEVEADLVDVGNGTAERDYLGKEVRGKLVLAGAQPGPVARLAVERFGAAGIVSYAQNQRTAWWGENDNLIRWGHLETFAPSKTFAFMVSLKEARALQQRIGLGQQVRFSAKVVAGKHDGDYEVVTATIPGADPRLKDEEVAFSCHLDHQRPGANDNASGCVAILEAARTLAALIASERIPRPARTLRFIWPPEIEGTHALLNGRPELGQRIRAVIHMDMVGGGPDTKATFHVTRGPASFPSFVYDVGATFGAFVNRQSAEYAGTGTAAYPLVSAEGGKEPLQADFADFSQGSDHEVYTDASYGIPAIYLNDWPDRYIHTNLDAPANVDPTKLKRAAFIGAASGYFLAAFGPSDVGPVVGMLRVAALRRAAALLPMRAELPDSEQAGFSRFRFGYERALLGSIDRFAPVPAALRAEQETFLSGLERTIGGIGPARAAAAGAGQTVYRRNPAIKGPLSTFGYDYLADHYGAERTGALRLPAFSGRWGSGYPYEVLNLVDGRRSVREIRDAVSAIYGPVPVELVAEYLAALEEVKLVSR